MKFIILAKEGVFKNQYFGIAKDTTSVQEIYEWAWNRSDFMDCEFTEERAKEIIRDHHLTKYQPILIPA